MSFWESLRGSGWRCSVGVGVPVPTRTGSRPRMSQRRGERELGTVALQRL